MIHTLHFHNRIDELYQGHAEAGIDSSVNEDHCQIAGSETCTVHVAPCKQCKPKYED